MILAVADTKLVQKNYVDFDTDAVLDALVRVLDYEDEIEQF